VLELPQGVKETLDKVLSGETIRLLFERAGGLLDQLAGGAHGGGPAEPEDDGRDDDDGHGSSVDCRSTGQAGTWWSGSARSGCP
jgi:hypothetical protein